MVPLISRGNALAVVNFVNAPLVTYFIHLQTVVVVVMGGVIVWLIKKIGQPVAEFLDGRSAVSTL